jgi:siroheme synthase
MVSSLEKGRKWAMEIRWNLPGKVYVVGARLDSAKRLTVRAAEALRRADVVFHDDAVPGELLKMVPSWTAVYNLEKAGGNQHATNEEIDQRIIAAARSGQTVVCLKAGASPMFGEISAVREAGIALEVLADVTAKAEEVIELFRAENSDVEARNDLRA